MPGDLRIARTVVGGRGRNRLGLADLVDLHDPGRYGAARRLPDKTGSQPTAQRQHGEKSKPPVLGLHSRRTNALVPDLPGLLIWRLGLGGRAVADGRSSKHHLVSFGKVHTAATDWAIAGADRVVCRIDAVADGLIALHALGPSRRRTAG